MSEAEFNCPHCGQEIDYIFCPACEERAASLHDYNAHIDMQLMRIHELELKVQTLEQQIASAK